MSDTTVVIPSWSGRELLLSHLPVLSRALPESSEIIVVDDASTDGTAEMVRSEFPDVNLIARAENGGFSAAANDGIRAAQDDLVLLLNDDVEVTPSFLDPIVPLFEDESVFAVSPRIILPSRGNLDEAAKTGFWHHGMFYVDQRQGVTDVMPVLYATGAAAVYRRSMLESLGGFDEAYSPFYWEDADLGYRAWKRGWKTLYQPAATVYHLHSSSVSKMKQGFTARIKARNALSFIWRNIEDERLIRGHRRWLPLVLARRAASADGAFLRGWRDAFARRDEAISARDRDSKNRKLSDLEIFRAVRVATHMRISFPPA